MKRKDKAIVRQSQKNSKRREKELRNKFRKQKSKDSFKLSPTYVNFFRGFDKQLEQMGLQLRDVGGDGNCLFRAVSDQLEGHEGMHDMYRKWACQHIKQNEEFYSMYLDEDDDGDMDSYLREMAQDREWGGNLELHALSEYFNMNIVIHRKFLDETVVQPLNEKKDIFKKRFTIHLAYFQEEEFEHYASVRVIGDDSDAPSVTSLSKLQKYRHLDVVKEKKKKWEDSDEEEEKIYRKSNAHQEDNSIEELEQPYPNYPRNKKCKCNSGQPYKNCCYKQYEKRKAHSKK